MAEQLRVEQVREARRRWIELVCEAGERFLAGPEANKARDVTLRDLRKIVILDTALLLLYIKIDTDTYLEFKDGVFLGRYAERVRRPVTYRARLKDFRERAIALLRFGFLEQERTSTRKIHWFLSSHISAVNKELDELRLLLRGGLTSWQDACDAICGRENLSKTYLALSDTHTCETFTFMLAAGLAPGTSAVLQSDVIRKIESVLAPLWELEERLVRLDVRQGRSWSRTQKSVVVGRKTLEAAGLLHVEIGANRVWMRLSKLGSVFYERLRLE